jgi:hypothetical protein
MEADIMSSAGSSQQKGGIGRSFLQPAQENPLYCSIKKQKPKFTFKLKRDSFLIYGVIALHHHRGDNFLSLWKDADPGIAEVDDARERVAGLRSQ